MSSSVTPSTVGTQELVLHGESYRGAQKSALDTGTRDRQAGPPTPPPPE
jgi:hypothetical protein